MVESLKQRLAPPLYEDEVINSRARFLNVILLSLTGLLTFLLVIRLVSGTDGLASGGLLLLAGAIVVLLGIYGMTRLRFLQLGIYALVSISWLAVTLLALNSGGVRAPAFMGYLAVILVASMLSGWRLALLFIGLTILTGWGFVYVESAGQMVGYRPAPTVGIMVDYSLVLGFSGVVIYLLVTNLQNALRSAQRSNQELQTLSHDLEIKVQARTQALETSLNVSRRLTAILNQPDLAREVVYQVQSAFNYYHAQMYLYDPSGEDLVLVGSTGEAGQVMLANNHKITGGQGLVGRAAMNNRVVLVPNTASAADWLPNPLLPETKAEAAVPISLDGQVLGVLDVQHDVANGLTEDDTRLMESVAAQVAIALRNARLFAQAQQQAERETLINAIGQQIRSASSADMVLQVATRELSQKLGIPQAGIEISRDIVVGNGRSAQITVTEDGHKVAEKAELRPVGPSREGWASYLDAINRKEKLAYVYDARRSEPGLATDNLPVVTDQNIFELPITVADSTIGSIQVVAEDGRPWTTEAVSLVTLVGRQVAQQLENLRLLEEAEQYRLEAEEAVQRLTSQGWQTYQDEELLAGFVYDGTEVKALSVGQIDEMVTDRIYSLPLEVRGETIGHLELAGVPVLDEETKNLLPAFTQQLSDHIENLRLSQQNQQRTHELAILNEMSQALTAQTSVDGVFQTVYETLSRLMNTTNFYAVLFDEKKQELIFVLTASGEEQSDFTERRSVGQELTAFIIHQREPLLLPDNVGRHLQAIGVDTGDRLPQAWLGAPIILGRRVLGAICLQSYTTPRLYNRQHLRLLTAVASQTAIAIESARLLEDSLARAEEEQILRQITTRVSTATDAETILRTAAEEIGRALGLEGFIGLEAGAGNGRPANSQSQTAGDLKEK